MGASKCLRRLDEASRRAKLDRGEEDEVVITEESLQVWDEDLQAWRTPF
jgi:hypothetical protein